MGQPKKIQKSHCVTVDKGYLFVWDPSENVAYLVAPQDIKRCRLKIPRNARICASRVVEYVLQYDEEISPIEFSQGTRLTPTPTAIPAESSEPTEDPPLSVEEARAAYPREEILDDEAAPSVADAEGPNLADVAEDVVEEKPVESEQGGAAPSAPKGDSHPLDDVPLADLADGEPLKVDALKKEAETPEHMLTHFPKNPFCRICNKPDSKDDDYIDPPKEVFEQLATDDVILAKRVLNIWELVLEEFVLTMLFVM